MVDITDSEGPVDPTRAGIVAGSDPKDIYDDVTAAVSVRAFDAPSADLAGDARSDDRADVRIESAHLQPSDDEALDPGFLLNDRFKIVELVHSGGMGHVYKALDERRRLNGSEQVHVAIKMMRSSVTPQLDAQFALEREAAKTQRLSHPNIVNIYDFDQHGEQFYLVMEWLEGESVNSLLRRTSGRPLAPQFAWQVIEGIARGLQHSHSKNVVHADINPSNIFITDTQEIKLLDFGVARYDGDPQDVTGDGVAWATRTYASPEVLSGLPPTFGDDIFSLGCVAYRLLSGRHPFAGWSSVDARQAGVTPQPIPGLSETRWKILSRALSYEQSDRPDTVSAFLTELPGASGAGVVAPVQGRSGQNWLLATSVVAIAIMAGAWWLWEGGVFDEQLIPSATNLIDDPISVNAEVAFEPTEIDNLLSIAAQAMAERRYLMPESSNARALYLEVLALDPDNSMALTGLREIGDVYVRQAETALRTGDPASAIAALTIAAETDPDNPAITIVDELLQVQSNVVLANARLAAADGDTNRARDLLITAEQYAFVDANAINAVTRRIDQVEQERQNLLDRLSAADAAIDADRLTAPATDNAWTRLIELQRTHGTDPRVVALTERLSNRLLNRMVFAIAAGRFPEATESLDAADSLGVLGTEVAAARITLQLAEEEARVANNAALESNELAAADSPVQAAPSDGASEQLLPQEYATGEPASLLAATSNATVLAPGLAVDQDTQVTDALSEPQLAAFSDLAIEKYVAPSFPRRAIQADMSGAVELRFNVNPDGSTGDIEIVHSEPRKIFVPSASFAVRQWRFAQRDDVIRAQVTLRFEQPPE